MARRGHIFGIVLLALHSFVAIDFAAAADSQSPPSLSPIYRVKLPNGGHRLVTPARVKLDNLQVEHPAFFAVVTNEWLAGLAPLFAVEKTNRIELRRRPLRGQENFTEPLFFALPPDDDPDAAKLIGRWDCKATRDGSRPYVGIELTLEGDRIAGRFDQNTDYRFAFITGGTFKSNRLELRVEYIKEVYLLAGDWREGKLTGEWRQMEDAEKGTWEASRLNTPIPPANDTVALYEWRRQTDGAISYGIETEQLESPWQREPRPVCRVWRDRAK
jgi:hypothetical protein